MRRSALLLLVGLTALVPLAIPRAGSAQTEISARAATIRLGGRFHFQMATTSAPERDAPDFFVRRARLVADIEVTDFLDGRLQPSFVTGKVLLEDAYFRLNFDPAFRVYFGQFKQAFDIFENTSSTLINVVERSGDIPGIAVCPGVSGICSYGRFSERLQYGGRDTGLRADGVFADRWAYEVTVTNGEGILENADPNGRKTVAGRLSFSPVERLTVSAALSAHDYSFDVPDGQATQTAIAWGGDLQYGDFLGGWLVQWALMGGDNWKALLAQDEPARFLTTQAIVSYYHTLPQGGRLAGIEPALRVSWGDPDADGDSDAGVLITPGLNLYVLGRNRINSNLDAWIPQEGDTEWSLRAMTYLYF